MPLILAADDSEEELAFMAKFLQSFHYECRLASSGIEAMDLLSVEKFDLIISDYLMENGSGVWLLKELNQLETPPPCIIITSDRTLSADHFLSLGARGFCYKPIIWYQLKSEIDRLLGTQVFL